MTDWINTLPEVQSTFLRQYIGAVERLLQRDEAVQKVMKKAGIGEDAAAMSLPPKYHKRQIGKDFGISLATVQNIHRCLKVAYAENPAKLILSLN